MDWGGPQGGKKVWGGFGGIVRGEKGHGGPGESPKGDLGGEGDGVGVPKGELGGFPGAKMGVRGFGGSPPHLLPDVLKLLHALRDLLEAAVNLTWGGTAPPHLVRAN